MLISFLKSLFATLLLLGMGVGGTASASSRSMEASNMHILPLAHRTAPPSDATTTLIGPQQLRLTPLNVDRNMTSPDTADTIVLMPEEAAYFNKVWLYAYNLLHQYERDFHVRQVDAVDHLLRLGPQDDPQVLPHGGQQRRLRGRRQERAVERVTHPAHLRRVATPTTLRHASSNCYYDITVRIQWECRYCWTDDWNRALGASSTSAEASNRFQNHKKKLADAALANPIRRDRVQRYRHRQFEQSLCHFLRTGPHAIFQLIDQCQVVFSSD